MKKVETFTATIYCGFKQRISPGEGTYNGVITSELYEEAKKFMPNVL